jgi:membrane-associated phospholipid phosphatase
VTCVLRCTRSGTLATLDRNPTRGLALVDVNANSPMPRISIPPTSEDRALARFAAQHTTPALQKCARAVTWAADEHVLSAISVVIWLLSRNRDRKRRILADHLLATVAVSTALPHLLKQIVDQERPDRCMVGTDRRGVQTSGKPRDAFPSGHALHVGAIASALSWLYPKQAPVFWTLSGGLAATRVAVLAHWASDVLVGLALGAGLERALRKVAQSRVESNSREVCTGEERCVPVRCEEKTLERAYDVREISKTPEGKEQEFRHGAARELKEPQARPGYNDLIV